MEKNTGIALILLSVVIFFLTINSIDLIKRISKLEAIVLNVQNNP